MSSKYPVAFTPFHCIFRALLFSKPAALTILPSPVGAAVTKI